jgi:hypothetical protein
MTNADTIAAQPAEHLPLWLKLAYSAFMAVLVPVYWYYYGPTNFLYFCDVALFLTLAGIWLESPLLVSMCAVGILLPQMIWVLDFFGSMVGLPITGMTDYMFKHENSLFLRGLSSLLLTCFFLMPPPHPDPGLTPVNINYVWGLSDNVAQSWVSPHVWLVGLMVGMPLLLFAPVHWLLGRIAPKGETA